MTDERPKREQAWPSTRVFHREGIQMTALPVRIGIIGAGGIITSRHLPGFAKVDDCQAGGQLRDRHRHHAAQGNGLRHGESAAGARPALLRRGLHGSEVTKVGRERRIR